MTTTIASAARAVFQALLPLLVTSAIPAQERIVINGQGLVLACVQSTERLLRCDYRVSKAGDLLTARASVEGLPLPPPQFAARSDTSQPVAILALVDSGAMAHPGLRARITRHLEHILADAPEQHRFGAAAYGDSLTVLAAVGSSKQDVASRLTTDLPPAAQSLLYRSVLRAIELMSTASATRRVLLLMSSGRSDDQQVDHAQTVREARNRNVVIYAVGYPLDDADAESRLARLERLSADTGGVFTAASVGADGPADVFANPLAGIDNAGALAVELSPSEGTVGAGEHLVSITLETGSGPVSAQVPVFFAPPPVETQTVVRIEVDPPGASQSAAARHSIAAATADERQEPKEDSIVWWTLLLAAVALTIVIGLLVTLLLLNQRRNRVSERAVRHQSSHDDSPGEAYLVLADGDMRSHRVHYPAFKIGRLANNDLVLEDPSVSRHHAEIRRSQSGRYKIADLDSMNGIYVNGRRVRGCTLANGDEIEVGDVRFTFEIRHDDPLERDATAALDAVEVRAAAAPGAPPG